MLKVNDHVRCSNRCDKPHRKETIGLVTQVSRMVWPIKVEWLDGTWDFYDEAELEVLS